jgi:succinate-semialdehyde dehydrogenase/glutarate-semialdehyde dehydrogenase
MIHRAAVDRLVEGARGRRRGLRGAASGRRLTYFQRWVKNFYNPTVLADVTHAMRIMREETFGPVLPVMAFDSDEEAVAPGQ